MDDDNNIVVTDWRAPISSLYYDYEIGPCGFMSPEGAVNGNMTLKYQTSSADWLGITYKEDLESVVKKLEEKKENGEYPQHLWK